MNLGDDAIRALRMLDSAEATRPLLAAVRDALHEQLRRSSNNALDSDPALALAACGYARALRDIYLAVESAATGVPMNRVEKPAPVERRAK